MPDDGGLRTSVVADLGSLAEAVAAARPPAAPALAPGTLIGEHFEIEAPLGHGGMGVVYRARDRRLDRRVAVKLGLGGTDLARARREAVALARLAHPNVVTIYEVGDHAQQPFVAMELVDGGTARAWVAAAPRGWRAIVDLYVGAGRGLAAAHAAGLVHRDVKPENILVGSDGRARIADFGLARDAGALAAAVGLGPRAAPEAREHALGSAPTLASGSGPDGAVTAVGAVIGTPRYMAPEHRDGGRVDAHSDQFSFAVALYEALAALPPFPDDGAARTAAIASGALAAPTRGRPVPARVIAVLARALAAEPARRWPSMDAMVAALVRARRARWPYVAGGAGIMAAVAVTVWSLERAPAVRSVVVAPSPRPAACDRLPVDLAATWSPAVRARLVAASPAAATGPAGWLADILDHKTAAWARARQVVCADRPDPRWTPELSMRGARCLGFRRDEFAAAIAAPGTTAAELAATAQRLVDPAQCADPRVQARMVRPADPAQAAALDRVLDLADEAMAAGRAGDHAKARTLATQALAAAEGDAATVPAARAAALEALGEVELDMRELVAATDHLRQAYFAYRSLEDQVQTYRIALMLTQLAAAEGKADVADEWLEHTRAEATRTGATPEKRAAVEMVAAQLLASRGKLDDAIASIAARLPQLRDEPDPRYRTSYATALANKATFEGMAGHLEASAATAREALAVQERLFGPDHPDLIASLNNIGLAERDLGHLDVAVPALRRAYELAVRAYPAGDPNRLAAEVDYALAWARLDPAAARPLLRELLAAGDALDRETRAAVTAALGPARRGR